MELVKIPQNIDSIKLFPEKFENDETVFYHGTSEMYSDFIENFGLFPNHKPLTDYFYSIYNIADDVFSFTAERNSEFSEFNKLFKAAFEYFKEFTRISFSSVSLSAADYSIGSMLGGQGLRHLVNLKNELDKIDSNLLCNSYIDISDSQKHYIDNLENVIRKIKESNGVVYAFKFADIDKVYLSYENHSFHSVLLSFCHIPPSKIIGKMIIPNGTQINQDLIKEGFSKSLQMSQPGNTTTFLRKILSFNTKRNPFFNNGIN